MELTRVESNPRLEEVRVPLGDPGEGEMAAEKAAAKAAKEEKKKEKKAHDKAAEEKAAAKAAKEDKKQVKANDKAAEKAAAKAAKKEEKQEKKAAAKAAKEEKELKKKSKDYMKTHLSSERTFFKWVWTALNLGALGTFALVFFNDEGFPHRLIVTGIAWGLGLLFALYGLWQFHRRRTALLSTVGDPDTTWETPRAPALVVAAFVLMVLTLVAYAIASEQQLAMSRPVTAVGSVSNSG